MVLEVRTYSISSGSRDRRILRNRRPSYQELQKTIGVIWKAPNLAPKFGDSYSSLSHVKYLPEAGKFHRWFQSSLFPDKYFWSKKRAWSEILNAWTSRRPRCKTEVFQKQGFLESMWFQKPDNPRSGIQQNVEMSSSGVNIISAQGMQSRALIRYQHWGGGRKEERGTGQLARNRLSTSSVII
ncbi:hypothetical protein J6590_043474 [Homalodisca vitripennis]|nr:hypothetical protein J6590_043474 [Homalodisca vitripennis]